MALITGTVADIGMQPLSGDLSVTSVEFRPEGDVLVAPEIRSFPVVAGAVNAELLAGPCRLTIRVGSHARRSFDVVVPDVPSVALADLVESVIAYEPPVVSVVAGHRAAAESAAGRAESAAGRAESAADDVDAAIVDAAGQVVADVEADRVAAQAARVGAESARDAAALSESAAAASATAAATQATLAGERADDAGVARDAASGSAAAAAGSASAAAGSASDASGSATDADSARAAAVVARGGAETARTGAETARDLADGHAGRAEAAANSFDLTATATTGAAGSNAAVAVTGDGPAYGLSFTVPRGDKGEQGDTGPKGDKGDTGPKGDKGDTGERGLQGEQGLQGIQGEQGPRGLQGDKGDRGDPGPKGDRGDDGDVSQAMLDAAVATLVDNAPEALDTLTELAAALGNDPNFATTTATAIGERAKIDGAPAAYDTLGKLVTALQNHELGGSTDASLLTGALTDQVDAGGATVNFPGPNANPTTMSLTVFAATLFGGLDVLSGGLGTVMGGLESKSDVGHTHDGADITGALTDQVDLSAALVSYQYWDPDTEEVDSETLPLGPAISSALSYGASFELLADELESKSDVGHTHPVSEVTGLQAALDGKATTGHTHTKAQVGLGNVDNTSDANKPVSTATANALNAKADKTDSRFTDARPPTAHTHPVADLTATGTASSSTYLRGDGSWATPTNTTYSVPTQAEAEAGTATTARAFSAQRVRQAADAAIAAREWVGTQAQYDAIGTKNPNITYYIID